MPTSAHIQFYVDGDGAMGDNLNHDGNGTAYNNINDNCDGMTGNEVNDDGNSMKLSSLSMCRHLRRHHNGVVALVVMASLPSSVRRHLAVVDNDGNGMTGNEVKDDGDGTKLSSPLMHRRLHRHPNGIAALVAMVLLLLPMCRRLAQEVLIVVSHRSHIYREIIVVSQVT